MRQWFETSLNLITLNPCAIIFPGGWMVRKNLVFSISSWTTRLIKFFYSQYWSTNSQTGTWTQRCWGFVNGAGVILFWKAIIEESCFQLVNKDTRVQEVNGRLQKSCLDHVITNVSEKCNVPEVFTFGSSDHLPVMVIKHSRELRSQPKTIKKRNYKNFSIKNFLDDVKEQVSHGSFDKVLNSQNVSEACALFSGIFGSILNKHAPLKVFQVRNNYSPWLSKETKQMMKERDKLRDEAIGDNSAEKYRNYKVLRNKVSKRPEKDRIQYYKS